MSTWRRLIYTKNISRRISSHECSGKNIEVKIMGNQSEANTLWCRIMSVASDTVSVYERDYNGYCPRHCKRECVRHFERRYGSRHEKDPVKHG
jgi:hypothetical protein